jgi:Flp pilus assembly protein TadG
LGHLIVRLRKLTQRFLADDAGVTAIIFALAATALFGMAGAAIDGARWYSMRRLHANAIDAALLSAARALQVAPSDTSGALGIAATVYTTTLPRSTTLVSNSVAFVQADSGATVTFTGTAYLKTTFLSVIGVRQLNVTTPAKAILAQGLNQGSNLEIALMLDVTGSMCNDGTGPCTTGTKLDALKTATADLANIVLSTSSSTYTSRVAMVPFSSAVRIDADGTTNPLMQTLTGLPQTWSGWVTTWTNCSGGGYYVGEMYVDSTCTMVPKYVTNYKLMPCVTERFFESGIGFDAGDSMPSSGNWLNGNGGNRTQLSWDSSNTPITTARGLTAADPSGTWNYTSDGGGCPSFGGNEILPLTARLSDVTDRINTVTAYGPTAGALGTVWTQYLLSPNWGTIWTGTQRPGSYSDTQSKQSNGAPVLRKVAVLMTDGGFNTMRQGSNSTTAQMQMVSDKAIAVCTNMKKNGVEIYTVGFQLNTLAAAEKAIATQTLQSCGTDISHFYDSIDAQQLSKAFRDIALKLTPVRLTQ